MLFNKYAIREAIILYKQNPSAAFQVVITFIAFICLVPHEVFPFNLLSQLIFSILACNIFTKENLCFNHDVNVKLDDKSLKKIAKSRFNVIFCCNVIQFCILAQINPYVKNVLGEGLAWAWITSRCIVLHDGVRMFYQTFPEQSKIRLGLKMLTTRFIGKYIPLGSLLIYIIYLPYLFAYWRVWFVLSQEGSDAALTSSLFSMLLLIIVSLYVYYRLTAYLMKRVALRMESI
ncbi:hypothetical protein [Cardinium endosymbiont of Nabis limbatus]|uniref:hypothetical protein n=1 Tax=Cardinium endosymbiont of Nabis limbatus TaxID=3066217 RepID=UPI003AF35424